ncbi:hypothetical protein MA16_Dca002781 [Dendrobium catenatum]|uniref:Uncharacterized protein n=1 Tax=Dendrobium catenatum TaxID=906689 RepID=A0A2I0X8M2_9ASPA|nr:hypothetical protein MA16_Dca002781 [Dendrobium catenatum]
MEIRRSSGTLNEYFPESHFCATPDVRGNENICPENEVMSPVASKRSRKDGKLNLRKSLAWNPAFFTEEGVLDSAELSVISDSVTRRSSRLLSKTNGESSSMTEFNNSSKRPPLNNLEENFLSKEHAIRMSRSSNKRAANLFSITETSKHDGLQMSMTLIKTPSTKGITGNVPKLDAACLMLEKEKKAKVQIEQDTSILKLNSCPSYSNRSQRRMSCSAHTGMTFVVKENAQNFRGLPPAPIHAKQSTLKMPSSQVRLEKEKAAKPLFEKDPILLKLNSCPSPSTESTMETTSSGSAGIFFSSSQQTFNVPGLPPAPIQARPSALRMPSPSLGFFQQKMVTSSHSTQLHRTSQLPISKAQSLRKLVNLKRMAPSKPPMAQTERQTRKEGSNLAISDFEAHANMEIKQFNKKGMISSNACGRSNCLSDAAEEITTNCLSVSLNMDVKTRETLLGKPYNGRTMERELTDENCSQSQISCNPRTEGGGMIGNVQHFNGFESTSDSSQYSVGTIATEICPTSSEMHFPQNLDESNLKPLYVHAPVMNSELVMHKDAGDETFADTSLETLESISAVCGASEEELSQNGNEHFQKLNEDSTEEGGVQNGNEHFHNTISQVQQTIPGNSLSDVQLAASEECQSQNDLQLCELRNETSSVEENGLMPVKRVSLDNLKQENTLLKPHLSAVPYSEEWLSAIEAFGEVKRKAQDVGPFDCTKYTTKPFPLEE